MLDHFQKYPQMLSGKVDPIVSKYIKEKRCEDLTSALNAEGTGPAKSIRPWRKEFRRATALSRKLFVQLSWDIGPQAMSSSSSSIGKCLTL
ncbi:hypothetical protein AVEN_44446-1 [Araneus ventricosus]|uniref:Uncharacterized protein n=1 Tax=Araneus ventricosus TaxID=182803 RepID=A0A4Y1ZSS1_ARAVE|nr:hypothetical protein AVEN_44446-1 [Araneus ventricosus]